MRLVLNIVILVTVLAGLTAVQWHRHSGVEMQRNMEAARSGLRRFQQQIAWQTELLRKGRSEQIFPHTVDLKWFDGDLPENPLLPGSHPWLEIAGLSEKDSLHPSRCTASDQSQSRFWYNPANGCVRARVPQAMSDRETIAMYNAINGCNGSDSYPQGSNKE